MPNELILFVYYLMWYFLIALSCIFIFSGLDDLFFDIYYWISYYIRLWRYRSSAALTYKKLAEKKEQLIAVMVPCWHEAGVIGTMLRHSAYSIDYENYYIFVGVYPNDPPTVNEVQEVADLIPKVKCVIGKTPGPTNKASNLNGVYLYIKKFEKELGCKFDIFVLHDSEDVIHPLSFKLYNYLCPRKDMVQIPIFPLSVNIWNFTHWLYADEFSENHTKDMIVREAVKGHVPSAGVGTAFTRSTLEELKDPITNTPFAMNSLTEDYRTSLFIRMHNLKGIFVTQKILRTIWRPRKFFRKGYVQKTVKEYIATRALFPMEYSKAVKQKARWITGIVFQEWQQNPWPRKWILRFTLAHDRKAFITHFINGFGYFVFLFWLIYSIFTWNNPHYPFLQEQFNLHPWVWWIISAVTFLMFERMIQRVIAVHRVYGWIPAVLSIPRTFYGNILNLHAVLRAYYLFFGSPKTKNNTKQPSWDKTDHQFPGSHILTAYRIRFGDILLHKGLIQKRELDEALKVSKETGEQLGKTLVGLNLITEKQLLNILSEQYKLPLVPKSQLVDTKNSCLSLLPDKLKKWAIKNHINILYINTSKQKIGIGLEDPTNELFIESIINFIKPYTAEFSLIDSTA